MNEAEKKKLEKLHKFGLKDFLKTFSDPKYKRNNRNLLRDITEYMARYGMQGVKAECNFGTLLQTARNLVLSQFAEQHLDELDNTEYNYMGQLDFLQQEEMKEFINDPVSKIKKDLTNYRLYGIHGHWDINNENEQEMMAYLNKLEKNANRLGNQIQLGEVAKSNKQQDSAIEVLSRITRRLPDGVETIEQALEKNKGGVLERTFGTTSIEYKHFKTALKDFRNPNSVYQGNLNHLEKETVSYLKHVIPEFEGGEDNLPTIEQLATLTGTQKKRAEFCVNVLKSVHEAREVIPIKDKVERAINGEHIERNGAVFIEMGGGNNHQEFQQQIKADLEDFANNEEVIPEEMNKENEKELDPEEKENKELLDELLNV